MVSPRHVLVLGAGYTGTRVARLAAARGLRVTCTVRSDERASALRAEGHVVLQATALDAAMVQAELSPDTLVVVCFPPDGSTDARIAPALTAALGIRYVSTTGVYPSELSRIDQDTPAAANPSPAYARVLAAEASYRAQGAVVLRCPGIYGRERGLHVRVVEGKHRLAGLGDNVTARIHVDDLAVLLLARPELRDRTYVVGDGGTETQREVVAWICAEYGVPFPPSAPAADVHPSLRTSRRIDPSAALRELGVTLRYPSFREGMAR